MSDPIRVGLIGYGYASKTFHAPLIAGTPGLELAAVEHYRLVRGERGTGFSEVARALLADRT